MRIEWVNHASFVLEHGDVRLMTDPWLSGEVFDSGLALMSQTVFTDAQFSKITHIWVSHEHPDHFHPASLMRIPAGIRANITLLYQNTDHHKVAGWARSKGFREVIELDPSGWHDLGGGLEILCVPYSRGDAWIAFRAGGKLVLNLNDCVVETEERCQQIHAQLGGRRPDLLMSQFSYGGWAGNRDDPDMRTAYANEMLQRLHYQSRIFKPKWFLPMASFVWFCHRENYYMNDRPNKVGNVADFLERRCSTKPLILYPGDSWQVGTKRVNRKAIRKYNRDYARIANDPEILDSPPVSFQELADHATAFLALLKKNNGWKNMRAFRKAKLMTDATIWITDMEQAALLSPTHGLCKADTDVKNCDIAVSSSALSHCLQFPWGGDNLAINGRYHRPPGGYYHRFKSYFAIMSHNHHKKNPPPKEVLLGAERREKAVADGTFAPGQ
jgi:hypothetical protein